MNFAQTVVFGAFAGFTIYLGLPLGRITQVSPRSRTFLSMVSAGIIFYLLFDMLDRSLDSIAGILQEVTKGQAQFSDFAVLLSIFILGFSIGLIGLFTFEKQFLRADVNPARQIPASRISLMIAFGLGLHNFSEGLAIGQLGGRGELAFALLLIVGFGLHSVIESLSIVCVLGGERPAWSYLAAIGLIAGGPTLIGAVIGYHITSLAMSILFFSLASGALIYVLGELFILGRREAFKSYMAWGLFVGFLLAYFTDLILIASKIVAIV